MSKKILIGSIQAEGNLKQGQMQLLEVYVMPKEGDMKAKISIERRYKIPNKDGTYTLTKPASFRTSSIIQIERLIRILQDAVKVLKRVSGKEVRIW